MSDRINTHLTFFQVIEMFVPNSRNNNFTRDTLTSLRPKSENSRLLASFFVAQPPQFFFFPLSIYNF